MVDPFLKEHKKERVLPPFTKIPKNSINCHRNQSIRPLISLSVFRWDLFLFSSATLMIPLPGIRSRLEADGIKAGECIKSFRN